MSELIQKIAVPGKEYRDHGLDIESYLLVSVPEEVADEICEYRIFLVIWTVDDALHFLWWLGIFNAVRYEKAGERPCFEKTFLSEREKIIVIGNIASEERAKHYEWLIQSIADTRRISLRFGIIRYPGDAFFDHVRKELSNLPWLVKRCVIGYGGEFEAISPGGFKKPTVKSRSHFFSYRYYNELETLFLWHVFGWNSYRIAEFLLNSLHTERFAYVGNCGGLGNLMIGQLVRPRKVIWWNQYERGEISFGEPFHLSVPSPLVETKEFLKNATALGVSTVDVEYSNLSEKIGIERFSGWLVVSDLPGKKHRNLSRIALMKEFKIWLAGAVEAVRNEFEF